MPTPPAADRRPDVERPSDNHALNWLLLVPIVICLAVPFYNRTDPTLFGIPFFYWFQLAIIPIGVVCTMAVFLGGRRRAGGR